MLHSRNMKHNLNLIYQRVLQLVQTFCKNFHNLTFEELETKDIQAAYIKNDLKFENQIKKGNVTLNNERYLPFCWKIKQPSNQETFQRRFNVAFRLAPSNQRCFNFVFQLWFEQSYHFQRRLSFSFEQRCHFQRRFSQHWAMLKQRCEYDHLKKNKNYASSQKQNNSFELQRIGWTQNLLHFILHFKRICKKIFAGPQIS